MLGDNGSGKSTLLRSLALALMGPKEGLAARQNWSSWLGNQATPAKIELKVSVGAGDQYSGQGNRRTINSETFSIDIKKDESRVDLARGACDGNDPDRYIWGSGGGWFSAGFGPFRRFEGGDAKADRLFHTNPKLAAHITLFGEDIALTECLPWLKDLYLEKLENKVSDPLLPKIEGFINQSGFLPFNYKLDEVNAEGVTFIDGNGRKVAVEELSDGFRSFLSMTFELIRQMKRNSSSEPSFDGSTITTEGVVLIDEMDAHLHPNWQKEIGFRLSSLFPNIQFIVSSHSPLICHAAKEVGSILRMPSQGSGEGPKVLSGLDRNRLVYGDIIEGLSTSGFEAGETRSEEANKMLDELASLNVKDLDSKLSEPEHARQTVLRDVFPLDALVVSTE